jgi:putative oxidoreductase
MSGVRRIARPLLATQFVVGGLDAYRHPATRARMAAPMVAKLAPALSLPNDPELLVRANGAVMAGAGTLLAAGKLPRLSALALALSLIPTTAAGHPFWTIKDPKQRAQQRLQLLKNLSMLGGLLLAVVDTGGKPGLGWRARRAAKDAKRSAGVAKRETAMMAKAARREARLARHHVADALQLG